MSDKSRVCYGKMYTVEFYNAVQDFGMVHKDSMALLEQQWRDIINLRLSNAVPDPEPAPDPEDVEEDGEGEVHEDEDNEEARESDNAYSEQDEDEESPDEFDDYPRPGRTGNLGSSSKGQESKSRADGRRDDKDGKSRKDTTSSGGRGKKSGGFFGSSGKRK
jgi:hypothetical protein